MTATARAAHSAVPVRVALSPRSSNVFTAAEISTAAIPAAIPAAAPHASAPRGPRPVRPAPATTPAATSTAAATANHGGRWSPVPAAGRAATRKTARPPQVQTAPIPSRRDGRHRSRTERIASAMTSPPASTGCTMETGARASATTCSRVPSTVALCPATHFGRVTSRRRSRPWACALLEAASCCSTEPTANMTAAAAATPVPGRKAAIPAGRGTRTGYPGPAPAIPRSRARRRRDPGASGSPDSGSAPPRRSSGGLPRQPAHRAAHRPRAPGFDHHPPG